MNILYIGDVMGRPGRKVLAKVLPALRIKHDIDAVIAQAENVSHGKGMSLRHYSELEECGVDGFSGGNHTFERTDTMLLVANPEAPVVAPTNVEGNSYGNYALFTARDGKKIAILSLLGYTIPNGYSDNVRNPLLVADEVLLDILNQKPTAIIVNIHGDVSSEKIMMGYYLDGKVTAVVGDHWHVPTADARVLPKGSAHVSDVGMCGALNSSIGVDIDRAIKRWRGEHVKNHMAEAGALQFNAVLIKTLPNSMLAESIERVYVQVD